MTMTALDAAKSGKREFTVIVPGNESNLVTYALVGQSELGNEVSIAPQAMVSSNNGATWEQIDLPRPPNSLGMPTIPGNTVGIGLGSSDLIDSGIRVFPALKVDDGVRDLLDEISNIT